MDQHAHHTTDTDGGRAWTADIDPPASCWFNRARLGRLTVFVCVFVRPCIVQWNFEKFLVNKQGKVVERYSSLTKPEEIEATIKKLLSE